MKGLRRFSIFVLVAFVWGGFGSPAALAGTAAADSARVPLRLPPPPREEGTPRALIGAGAGLALGIGSAVWLKSRADERFDRYRVTADQARAKEYFDAAKRYDRLSLAGWAVAQVSFVALFYLLTREEDRPLIPAEGEPLLHGSTDGFQLGWRIAP